MKTLGKIVTGFFAVIGFIATIDVLNSALDKTKYLDEKNEDKTPLPCSCEDCSES